MAVLLGLAAARIAYTAACSSHSGGTTNSRTTRLTRGDTLRSITIWGSLRGNDPILTTASSAWIQADDALVNIGSFPRNDPHMVMLRSVSPRVSRVVRLLVVPPEWEEQAAVYAIRAAAAPSNTATGSAILDESLDLLLAGHLSYGDGSGVGSRMSAAGPMR